MILDLAPCVHDGVLSLALCKPAIRKSAVVGSWVIALASKKIFGVKGLMAFLFQVTSTVSLTDYHRDAERPDKIYCMVEGDLVHKGETSFHSIGPESGTQQARDRQGKVLMSTCFVKFELSNPLPLTGDLCPLVHQHIGQKKSWLTPELNVALLRLVEAADAGDLRGVSSVSFLPHQQQPSVSSSFFFLLLFTMLWFFCHCVFFRLQRRVQAAQTIWPTISPNRCLPHARLALMGAPSAYWSSSLGLKAWAR